jgi:dienelactone hydrolase
MRQNRNAIMRFFMPWARGLLAIGLMMSAPGLVHAGEQAGASPLVRETRNLSLAGRSIDIDIHRPASTPRGAVILSHGFTRSRTTLAGHASALAGIGVLAVLPDLPYTFDFQRNAQALDELVALLRQGRQLGEPVSRVVLVGFSAGALSSLLAAASPGVVGYIGLDPFDKELADRQGALGRDFAPLLRTPAVLLRAPPSRCNAQAVAAPWAEALPGLVLDRVIDGASHCDFESPTDWICRLACGDTDPARQAIVRDTLLEAVSRWLPAALTAAR